MLIHPTAIIDPTAQLGEQVQIGPYAIVGPHCVVGDRTRLDAHAVLQEYVKLGADCQVSSGAVLGGHPQDFKFKGEPSYVRIGQGSIIRECVTVNRSTGEGNETVIGEKAMLMAYSHVAHNCILGDEVILANAVQLGGHVEIGDFAFIGGSCAIHQFVKIGKLAIVAGLSATRMDLPPFATLDGRPAVVAGINKVGLKRRGFDLASRTRLKRAFKLLFFANLNYKQAIETIHAEIEPDPAITELVTFVQQSPKGIFRPTRVKGSGRKPGNMDLLTEADEAELLSDTLL
jgi:UDP-N-acetylglucosamine acyltransferase